MTTQHAPVKPDPGMAETVISDAITPAAESRLGSARTNGVQPGATRTGYAAPVKSEPDFDYFDDDLESEEDDSPQDESAGSDDEVKAIDATLARFSAVHDEIALEEAERRKKFAWLRGKYKEPELGRDMPFDFAEGRDAQSSRVEWKQQERKQRTTRILQVLAVVAVLAVVVIAGVSWFA